MLLELLLGFLALFLMIYWYVTKSFNYWTKNGVYQIEPQFPFGSMTDFFFKRKHLLDVFKENAQATKGLPFYGMYFLTDPFLVVTDPEVIRNIMVKDFDHFVDRNFATMKKLKYSKHKTDIIWMNQLTGAEGDNWKNLRTTFTPIFTSGKMKAMLIFMQETCNRLMNAMDYNAANNTDFELKEMLGKYSMDTIASCAFGVDSQAFTNSNSKFVESGSKMFKTTFVDGLKFLAIFLPFGNKVLEALKISIFKEKETDFFYNVVMDSIKHRRESKMRRNDLIDLMIDAIKGDIKADEADESEQFEKDAKLNHTVKKKGQFDELIIVATSLVILAAGYDTTGSALAFACYQLSKNPDVQDKLREEVNSILENDPSRDMTYNDLQSMTYLDQVLSETLRFHNVAVVVQRCCTKDYKIPGHDLVIKKDQNVWIDNSAPHFDPEYYETPNAFNPEHFNKEAKAKRNPYAYLPFGQGPRGCLGMRFALLEAKLALANIVRRYDLLPSDKTKEPLELDPDTGALTYVKHGLFIKVEKRN